MLSSADRLTSCLIYPLRYQPILNSSMSDVLTDEAEITNAMLTIIGSFRGRKGEDSKALVSPPT